MDLVSIYAAASVVMFCYLLTFLWDVKHEYQQLSKVERGVFCIKELVEMLADDPRLVLTVLAASDSALLHVVAHGLGPRSISALDTSQPIGEAYAA